MVKNFKSKFILRLPHFRTKNGREKSIVDGCGGECGGRCGCRCCEFGRWFVGGWWFVRVVVVGGGSGNNLDSFIQFGNSGVSCVIFFQTYVF